MERRKNGASARRTEENFCASGGDITAPLRANSVSWKSILFHLLWFSLFLTGRIQTDGIAVELLVRIKREKLF